MYLPRSSLCSIRSPLPSGRCIKASSEPSLACRPSSARSSVAHSRPRSLGGGASTSTCPSAPLPSRLSSGFSTSQIVTRPRRPSERRSCSSTSSALLLFCQAPSAFCSRFSGAGRHTHGARGGSCCCWCSPASYSWRLCWCKSSSPTLPPFPHASLSSGAFWLACG